MIITCREAARILHVTPQFVTELMKSGGLPHQQIGAVKRLVDQAVCDWLLSRRVPKKDETIQMPFDKLTDEQDAGINDWLTTKEAAALIGISIPTLMRFRQKGAVPFYRLSVKALRYRKCELEEWGN